MSFIASNSFPALMLLRMWSSPRKTLAAVNFLAVRRCNSSTHKFNSARSSGVSLMGVGAVPVVTLRREPTVVIGSLSLSFYLSQRIAGPTSGFDIFCYLCNSLTLFITSAASSL